MIRVDIYIYIYVGRRYFSRRLDYAAMFNNIKLFQGEYLQFNQIFSDIYAWNVSASKSIKLLTVVTSVKSFTLPLMAFN